MVKYRERKLYKDITGQVFNRLTVLEYAGPDKWKNAQWKCLCSCGKEIITLGARLRCGSAQSCGCYSIDRTKETHTTKDSYFKRVYRNCRDGAKRRGYVFELTEEKYLELVLQTCYYCGREPYEIKFAARHHGNAFPCNGIDRKDNKLGYIVENCVPCCGSCNTIKMDFTEKEFYNTIELIYNNRIRK